MLFKRKKDCYNKKASRELTEKVQELLKLEREYDGTADEDFRIICTKGEIANLVRRDHS